MAVRKKVTKKRMKRGAGATGAGGGRTRKTKLAKRLSKLGPREKAKAVARLRAKRKGR